MLRFKFLIILTGCLLLDVNAARAAVVTTLDGSQGWIPYDVRGTGTVGITNEEPRSGNGSLALNTSVRADKSSVRGYNQSITNASQIINPNPFGTLDALAKGNITFDLFKDSSSTSSATIFPSLKFSVREGGRTVTLIWETVYNDRSFNVKDDFVQMNLTGGKFWMHDGSAAITEYNFTLQDWADGRTSKGSVQLSKTSQILAVEIGVGSGANTFKGFADNVNFSFAGGESFSYNFETEAAAVPEPSIIAYGSIGALVFIGYGWKKRRKAIVS